MSVMLQNQIVLLQEYYALSSLGFLRVDVVDAGSSKRLLGLPLLVVVVVAVAAKRHSVGTGQHWLGSVHCVGES